MLKAPIKGSLGYVSRLKKHNISFVLINTLVSAMIFIIGYLMWETKSNICTIFAVCSLLPGCKRLVNLIVIFPFKDMTKENQKTISEKIDKNSTATIYNDLLVASEKYYLSFGEVFFAKSKLIAFSEMSKDKIDFADDYLNKAFDKRGYDVRVTICNNVKDYIRIVLSVAEEDMNCDKEAKAFFESLFI